jgi:hypothetical protein
MRPTRGQARNPGNPIATPTECPKRCGRVLQERAHLEQPQLHEVCGRSHPDHARSDRRSPQATSIARHPLHPSSAPVSLSHEGGSASETGRASSWSACISTVPFPAGACSCRGRPARLSGDRPSARAPHAAIHQSHPRQRYLPHLANRRKLPPFRQLVQLDQRPLQGRPTSIASCPRSPVKAALRECDARNLQTIPHIFICHRLHPIADRPSVRLTKTPHAPFWTVQKPINTVRSPAHHRHNRTSQPIHLAAPFDCGPTGPMPFYMRIDDSSESFGQR